MKMKNISELMVDLAYSAIFLQDKEISEEVMELSKEISLLENETLKYIFKVRGSDDDRIKIINFMDYVTDITKAAVQIANLVKEGEVSEVLKNVLGETDERVITAEIKLGSIMCEKTIESVGVRTKTRANIITIRRGGRWIFDVKKTSILHRGDLIVATGNQEAEKLLKKMAIGKLK
jgi:uncharacterized protein with PhoU and TrkA domain